LKVEGLANPKVFEVRRKKQKEFTLFIQGFSAVLLPSWSNRNFAK